jgi:hypothetical protein
MPECTTLTGTATRPLKARSLTITIITTLPKKEVMEEQSLLTDQV